MAASPTLAHGFQYAGPSHQAETAVAGMWLFLATEVLLFGGLILSWIYARHFNPLGFAAGARETELRVGTLNTAILISSSFTYALGLSFLRAGNSRRLLHCLALTLLLGAAFLALKFGLEWHDDFRNHLFPTDARFKIVGAENGGARLFFSFYFIGTALHGLHMTVGVALVIWIILRARRGEFSARYHTPVHLVGLYWSFVDIVWLALYPLIYLIR
ncbi:MAG TPA: cytochrome c oxidase subunit 3 [Steroidobacteraceae bacterium]|jgi:cytochrome c oxidase subunit 3|nr:cytochrome c oxidase subunit 3 [Steroidobacteraceae bacterium]